jgi:predicted RNase H-like nuclease (RuvC/YqgF family)
MWPRRESCYPRPSVEFLCRNYVPPLKAPEPLPEKYHDDHAMYLIALTDATLAIDELLLAVSEKVKEMNELSQSMTSFNRWKDTNGKTGRKKKLEIEVHTLETKLSEKKTYREALVRKNERLVKLIDLQISMESAYTEYVLDSQVTYDV